MNFKLYLEHLAQGRYEIDEIKRTVEELNLPISDMRLVSLFDRAKEKSLDKKLWDKLENCDIQVRTENDIKEKLKEYSRPQDNYDKIKHEWENNIWYPPLIITSHNDWWYLVAGNTRMMFAKINNITPKVKIVDITNEIE